MEAPLVSNARPRWAANSLLHTTPGAVVISLQCVWLLSLQLEVAHLKHTAVDAALLQERARVESQGRWPTPVRAGAESAAQSLFTYLMMAPNLISNGFMNNLNGQRPQGFSHLCILRRSPYTSERGGTNCVMSISAVHPFTQCFEGPYCDNCAAKYPHAARTCNEATEQRPYIFGTWNMGPRSGRGGLSGGWGGHRDGKILKIHGVRAANWQAVVTLPVSRRVQTDRVLFRGFLKIISGKASIQTDIGCDPDPELTAMTSAAATATNGWLEIHKLVSGSRITNLGSDLVFNLNVYGAASDQTGPYEMYLALPYMANVVETLTDGQQSVAWVGSVEDQLVDDGLAAWAHDKIHLH